MVVGAGRGPLVAASMRAASRAQVPLRVYAVEKNPNAVVHIQDLLRREGWQGSVSIVSADMRHWRAPEPAHVLVSELLGSFGDNELSPECLDGAQRFLAPGERRAQAQRPGRPLRRACRLRGRPAWGLPEGEARDERRARGRADVALVWMAAGGVSIPCRYTSYLAPLSAHKLWTDVRQYKDREHFETPYVVKLHK